jgi:hypothetical protein
LKEAGAVDRINLQAATGLDDTPRESDAARRKDASLCGLFTNLDTHQEIDSSTIWSTLV